MRCVGAAAHEAPAATAGDASVLANEELAVTERRAADLCGLSIDTLRRYRRHGTGPVYIRIGGPNGPIRYRVASLDEWLQKSTFKSRAEELARGGDA